MFNIIRCLSQSLYIVLISIETYSIYLFFYIKLDLKNQKNISNMIGFYYFFNFFIFYLKKKIYFIDLISFFLFIIRYIKKNIYQLYIYNVIIIIFL
jgi:hypothetical protein